MQPDRILVLVLEDYDKKNKSSKYIEPNKKCPNKNLTKVVRKGEVFKIKLPLKWWLEIDSEKKAYIPSTICVPIDMTKYENITLDQDSFEVRTSKCIQCSPDKILETYRKYFPKMSEFFGEEKIPRLQYIRKRIIWISLFTYDWLNKLLLLGYRRTLCQSDICDVDTDDKCYYTSKNLNKTMQTYFKNNIIDQKLSKRESFKIEKEMFEELLWGLGGEYDYYQNENIQETYISALENENDPIPFQLHRSFLLKLIFKIYKIDFVFAILLKFIYDILQFVSPFLLGQIIKFVKNIENEPMWYGYVLVLILFLVKSIQTLILSGYFDIMTLKGNKIRCMLMACIYKKMMRLDVVKSKYSMTSGDQLNLLSVDCFRIQDSFTYINVLWSAPLQLILSLSYLGYLLKISMLPGLGAIVIFMPLNLLLGKFLKKKLQKQMILKDKRMSWVSQMFEGIRLIKFYTWENSFIKKIMDVRKNELKNLRTISYTNSFFTLFWGTLPLLIAFLCFITYVLLSGELDAEIAFISLSLIFIMRFPLSILPDTINSFVQMGVSISRIEKFLLLEEIKPAVERNSILDLESDAVFVNDGSFGWSKNKSEALIKSVDLKIPHGQFVAIIGKTGSGKSTFLSSLLGMTRKYSGRVCLNGSISYVGQTPWIQNMSLKKNILFDHKCDQERFENVIKKCSLFHDIEQLPHGLETEIGEKGVNLSGGQKQRVSIARAVYNDSDIYFLDDVLSAVDSHVSKAIFNDVLSRNGVLGSKTRILVTHKLDLLPFVDRILVLQEGNIIHDGCYEDLVSTEFFHSFVQQKEPQSATQSQGSVLETLSDPKSHETMKKKRPDDKLMTKEQIRIGKIKLKTFHAYLSALSYSGFITSVFLVFVSYFLQNISSYWVGIYSSDGINKSNYQHFFKYYGIIILSQAVCSYTGSVIFAFCAYRASRVLHNNILQSVSRAAMRYFETTPLGRILNLFSNDVNSLDSNLPRELSLLIRLVLQNIILFGIIVYKIPIFIIPLFITLVVYILIQNIFISSSRQLQRLESTSKSPLFSQFIESNQGINEIRAFDKTKLFINKFCQTLDVNQSLKASLLFANRWLALRLETIGNLLIFWASTLCIYSSYQGNIKTGDVGFIISTTSTTVQILNWMIRTRSELETQIVSVERLSMYDSIEKEGDINTSPENMELIPTEWPSDGIIEYLNYSTRYRPKLPLSLNGLAFKTGKFEKIGIVGRTGAGKSSLILSLFRMIEAAEGTIYIDGVDISKIGLSQLRKNITVIPQESFIFGASLRNNLDPLDEYTDDQIWRALEFSHLKDVVQSFNDGLSQVVFESGRNFSSGEKQLICLARALLKNSKIIVLDEATASVDTYTDSIIQKTIRSQFSQSTILTIAHRLNTIIDYDRILVMDNGKAIEFDTPQNLLQNTQSAFYSLAKGDNLV